MSERPSLERFQTYHGDVDDFPYRSRYKLRGTMRFDQAPVGWNARARMWCGTDRREPIRWHLGRILPYRWVDNRGALRYSRADRVARWLLGTRHDVEAREAGNYATHWFQKREKPQRPLAGVEIGDVFTFAPKMVRQPRHEVITATRPESGDE